jgi:hypothetical protein
MDQRSDGSLKSVSQKLSDKLHGAIEERDWPVVRDGSRALNFGNKSDEGAIDTLKTGIVILKGLAQIIKIILDCGPTFFNEIIFNEFID